MILQWNLTIMTTSYDTSLSSWAHPGGRGPPGWALEDRDTDRMGNYLSSVCVNHFTKWKTGNRLYYKGGRYWQVLLYDSHVSSQHAHGGQKCIAFLANDLHIQCSCRIFYYSLLDSSRLKFWDIVSHLEYIWNTKIRNVYRDTLNQLFVENLTGTMFVWTTCIFPYNS